MNGGDVPRPWAPEPTGEAGCGGTATALPNGQLLAERFQLQQRLGTGGMGEVYRALDLELEEVVALKVISPTLAATPKARAALRKEVRAARRVASPHVARTFELHTDNLSAPFIVMEYIEGGTLRGLLEQLGRLPPVRAVPILCDVYRGLAAAHASGVVHRDIKPSNIMLRVNGRAVLTDFGIASLAQEHATQTGQLAGTPAYMAPEQVTGASLGPAADVFSAAVVLFEVLGGCLPWTGESGVQSALMRVSQPPADLRVLVADLPEALSAWMARALARDPSARWASAHEAGEALAEAAGQFEATQMPRKMPFRSPWVPSGTGASDVPRVAVLPFRLPGTDAGTNRLGGLEDDLVTALGAYRGLRVISQRSVEAYAAERSEAWEVLANALGATHVLDASVRSTGRGIRVNVQLLAVTDGRACWSAKRDYDATQLLDLGDDVAAAVAEALDVGQTGPPRPSVSDERSAALYLAARRNLRSESPANVAVAIALLREASERAPEDRVIPSALALAQVRHWQLSGREGIERLREARKLLASLFSHSDLPGEAFLASGTVRHAMGDPVGAARALRRAVAAAPSLAAAHDMLGVLLMEGDFEDDANARIQSALGLEPELLGGRRARCRRCALLGDWSRHDVALRELAAYETRPEPLWIWRLRVALWRRDRRAMETLREELENARGINADAPGVRRVMALLGAALDVDVARSLPLEDVAGLSASDAASRLQLRAEIAAYHADMSTAFMCTAAAVGLGLSGLAWLRGCPLFPGSRSSGEWRSLEERLQRRAHGVLEAVRSGASAG